MNDAGVFVTFKWNDLFKKVTFNRERLLPAVLNKRIHSYYEGSSSLFTSRLTLQ